MDIEGPSGNPTPDRAPGQWQDDTPTKTTSNFLICGPDGQPAGKSHSDDEGHAQMLLACSMLMLFIAFALVGTGVWSSAAIAYALLGLGLMAAVLLPVPWRRY
jgi:hypothetical protein